MAGTPNWTETLTLRPEVVASDGGVGELQMSLHKAVFQTVDVPYREIGYYSDITQPTPNLVGFLARAARRLGGTGESVALFHLDQGMGGGKSHALVGLYHMASSPTEFFATDLGRAVLAEAQASGGKINLAGTRVVTLTADHFSPGKPTEVFGPATTLFERFLWAVVGGDRSSWDAFVAHGPNKDTLQQALSSVGGPVLILLDELMDYILHLSDASVLDSMPGEQAFLNALMDACDDVPQVAFVVVMIRSELDPEGYTPAAEDFRQYIARRLNRNGTTIAVTETADFAAIIRRRIFERSTDQAPGPPARRRLPESRPIGPRMARSGARPPWYRARPDRPRRTHRGLLPVRPGPHGPRTERMGQDSRIPAGPFDCGDLRPRRPALDANRPGQRVGATLDRCRRPAPRWDPRASARSRRRVASTPFLTAASCLATTGRSRATGPSPPPTYPQPTAPPEGRSSLTGGSPTPRSLRASPPRQCEWQPRSSTTASSAARRVGAVQPRPS